MATVPEALHLLPRQGSKHGLYEDSSTSEDSPEKRRFVLHPEQDFIATDSFLGQLATDLLALCRSAGLAPPTAAARLFVSWLFLIDV